MGDRRTSTSTKIAIGLCLWAMMLNITAAVKGQDVAEIVETPEALPTQMTVTTEQAAEEAEPAAVDEATESEEQKAEYIPSTKAEDGFISELQIMEITSEVGSLYNICPELLQSICYHESRYYVAAENNACKGLMQLNTNYMAERMEKLGVTDIYDEYSNILLAADLIAELRDTTAHGDDLYYVLMRYNMTTATANRLYEAGEVTAYAEDVAAYAEQLERLHGK